MRTLIVDNYDSFTFNLFQLIAAINGEEPIVVRNDQAGWDELADLAFDNIVISPGPGTPERDEDFGVCRRAIREARVPLLGVCLGHQGIGHLFGGKVRHAPEPMHGRLSRVFHDGSELWRGIPHGFEVVRYHSLMLDGALPAVLRRTAWTADEIVMGVAHESRPIWGVQFHPESICTAYGDTVLTNFRDLTRALGEKRTVAAGAPRCSVVPQPKPHAAPAGFRVVHRKLDVKVDPALVYAELFHDDNGSFWLDSSRAEPGLSRFSFMGAPGPHGLRLSGDGASIYDQLERELHLRKCDPPELPFDFNCGFVGYFAYEGGGMFLLADRMLAFDHADGSSWLVALVAPGEDDAPARAWFDEIERALRKLRAGDEQPAHDDAPIAIRLARSRERYLDDIAACKRLIRDGESYEVCLTNQIRIDAAPDALALYLTLRRVNPAPYSAFLSFGDVVVMSSSPERFLRIDREGWAESKPIKGTRPRGNTPDEDAALARELAASEKDRAENLMIVDLLRNDLGSVSQIGTVHVPELMQVESYATVHQLVSTVRGRLKPGLTAVDCVRQAFPGGSITGAPKRRTMRILDELEGRPRGVYTGAIGFFGLAGTADLSIVIRTLVERAGATTLGVGGAIVALSDPDEEFDETMVKARALIEAVIVAARGRVDAKAYEAAMKRLRESGAATF